MDGWKMSFLLGFPIFRGYVKLRGAKNCWFSTMYYKRLCFCNSYLNHETTCASPIKKQVLSILPFYQMALPHPALQLPSPRKKYKKNSSNSIPNPPPNRQKDQKVHALFNKRDEYFPTRWKTCDPLHPTPFRRHRLICFFFRLFGAPIMPATPFTSWVPEMSSQTLGGHSDCHTEITKHFKYLKWRYSPI